MTRPAARDGKPKPEKDDKGKCRPLHESKQPSSSPASGSRELITPAQDSPSLAANTLPAPLASLKAKWNLDSIESEEMLFSVSQWNEMWQDIAAAWDFRQKEHEAHIWALWKDEEVDEAIKEVQAEGRREAVEEIEAWAHKENEMCGLMAEVFVTKPKLMTKLAAMLKEAKK